MTPTTTQTQSFGDHVFTVHTTPTTGGWTVDLTIDDKHVLTTVSDQLLILPLEDVASNGSSLPPAILGLSLQLDCSSQTRVGPLYVEPSSSHLPDTDRFEYASPRRSRLAQPGVQSSLAALVFGVTGVVGITLGDSTSAISWVATVAIGLSLSALCWVALRACSTKRRDDQVFSVIKPSWDRESAVKRPAAPTPKQFAYRESPVKKADQNQPQNPQPGPRRRRADV